MTESKINKQPALEYRGNCPNGVDARNLGRGIYFVDDSHKVSQGVPQGANENGIIVVFNINRAILFVDVFGNTASFNVYYNVWNNTFTH